MYYNKFMLKLSQSFIGKEVLSLRTGGPIAVVTQAIINPDNLKIEGWHVLDKSDERLILLSSEVRDIIEQGIAVNDHSALSPAEDLIRLQALLELDFELIGKPVTTQSGKKLGKISDYAVDSSSLFVKKLYASQSIVKNFAGGTLSIDRTQIVEITTRRIIIEDATEKIKAGAVATSAAG